MVPTIMPLLLRSLAEGALHRCLFLAQLPRRTDERATAASPPILASRQQGEDDPNRPFGNSGETPGRLARALLIGPHQGRVANYVGGEDGGQVADNIAPPDCNLPNRKHTIHRRLLEARRQLLAQPGP